MKLKRVTIKDIAKATGYSIMTVSFALRNSEKVKEATRIKIHEAANKMGYRADPEMVRLMERIRRNPELETTEKFAVLNLDESPQSLNRDPFTASVVKGVRARLEKHGFDLIDYWGGDKDFDNKAIAKDLKENRISGLILPVMPIERAKNLDLDWSHFSVVGIDERPLLPHFHRVHPHHYNNLILLMNKLVGMGFKRIGFASVDHMLGLDNYAFFAAYHAYTKYLNRGVEPFDPLVDATNKKELKAWYHKHKPDCVIVTAGWLEGFFRATLDIDIPESLSMASLGAENESMAGIDQKPSLIGSATADLMMAHANRYERGIPPFAKTVMIDGSWKDGLTVSNSNK